ncbi:hypothetical protein ABKN59_005813 [Abortiporus biennis]
MHPRIAKSNYNHHYMTKLVNSFVEYGSSNLWSRWILYEKSRHISSLRVENHDPCNSFASKTINRLPMSLESENTTDVKRVDCRFGQWQFKQCDQILESALSRNACARDRSFAEIPIWLSIGCSQGPAHLFPS